MLDKDAEISVIIPFFNAERFLDKTIKCVLEQTFRRWELILINDASTDKSKDICLKYQRADNRIKLIENQQNKGVDRSRFSGIDVAKGDYIFFLDADDWISQDALALLYDRITKDKSDLVIGGRVIVLDRFKMFRSKPSNAAFGLIDECIENPILFDKYFISYFGVSSLPVNIWGKLYKTSVIKKSMVQPCGMKMGEDVIFNMRLHPYLEKISLLGKVIYFQRFGGMTSTTNPTLLQDTKDQYYIKQDFLIKHNYSKALPYIDREVLNCFYSHYENRFILDKLDLNKLRDEIAMELNDEIYNKLQVNDDQRYHLLINKDTDRIVEIVYNASKKRKLKHSIKKMIFKLFA